jgi:flagellin-like hook-associated protein FlgL
MSNDVVIGASMRANLLSLQRTNTVLDSTQYVLSTGRKVNSALDDPQSFFAAQALSNRAKDLARLLDGMGQSIQTIKGADKGVTSLTKLVEQAQAIATSARDEIAAGATKAVVAGDTNIEDAASLAALGIADGDVLTLQVGAAAAVDVTIATAAATTAQDLIDLINDDTTLKEHVEASLNSSGQLELRALNDDASIRISSNGGSLTTTKFNRLGLGDYVTLDAASDVTGTITSGRTLTSAAFVGKQASDTLHDALGTGFLNIAAGTVEVTLVVDGTTSDPISIDATTTIQDFLNDINSDDRIATKLSAVFDPDTGQIKIRGTASATNVDLRIASVGGDNAVAFGFGTGATDGTITAGTSLSEFLTLSGSGTLGQLEDDYNEMRKQIDALVRDASYRGVNLLAGDNLTTVFNEDRTSSLVTKGVDFTATGLGLSVATFATESTVEAILEEVKGALESVRSFGTAIANNLSVMENREEFTKETINTLTEGADKLTVADPNEEGAKMLALQTRLQLGVTSLSLASQSAQSVLRLFG